MIATLPVPRTPQRVDWLAQVCLDHFAREEAHLGDMLDILRALRLALLGKDQQVIEEALCRQQDAVRRSEELSRQRSEFCRDIGEHLGLPGNEVTLTALIAHLPTHLQYAAEQARARLRRDAAEVDRLNRAIATLLHSCLGFLRRFFDELTGRDPDGPYCPAGALRDTPSGSLIDARG